MFLAIRELKFSKLRYGLMGLIMLLVAWLTFIVTGLANGLSLDSTAALKNINGDYFVMQDSADYKLTRSAITPDILDKVRNQDGVTEAAPLTQQMMTLSSDKTNEKMDMTIFGVNPSSMLMPTVTEGNTIEHLGKNEIVVNDSLKKNGVKIGDILKNKQLDLTVKVVGFTHGEMFSHSPVIFMDLTSLQAEQKRQTFYYNAIIIKTTGNVTSSIENQISNITVSTKDQAIKNMPGFKEEQGSLTMMVTFLIIIAAFVQAVFFYVMTLQKTSQFGVLKAIGAKTWYLAKNLIGQVFIVALISVVISVGLTYGTSILFLKDMPFALSTGLVTQFSLLLIFVSIVGVLISLSRIAKVDAVEAIGRVE